MTGRRRGIWVVFGLLLVAHLRWSDGASGQATYLAVTVGASVLAWRGAGRRSERERFPWRCVAAGVTCSAIADVIYAVYDIAGSAPRVSVADVFWMASYVALAVGLSSLVVGGYGGRIVDIEGLIDLATCAVVAVIVALQFSAVRDLLDDRTMSVFSRGVLASYPILDAAILGALVQAILVRRLGLEGGVMLAAGMALWLVADFGFLVVGDQPWLRWLDGAWMLGALALGLSTSPHTVASRDPRDVGPRRLTRSQVLITLLPLLAPGLVQIRDFVAGVNQNPVPLYGATVTLVGLALARAWRGVAAGNRHEAALMRATAYYSALAENSSDAVVVVDRAGTVLNTASNLRKLLGGATVDIVGADLVGVLHPLDPGEVEALLGRWFSMTDAVDEVELAVRGVGGPVWLAIRAVNLSDNPDVGGVVVNVHDITDRKRAQDDLAHHAFHDSLTGLANRALLHDRVDHALRRTARTGFEVEVVYLDLDDFKTVNDSRGHDVGDELLREVAQRLVHAVRTADTVARLGGDEFAVLLEATDPGHEEAQALAERMLDALAVPFEVDGQQVSMSASIGIAVADEFSSASSLLRDADVAMYHAKTAGKSRWSVCDPVMRAATLERLDLKLELQHALTDDELRLVYQPVVDLTSGAVVGFEALLRWQHPTKGTISPATFIPIAEATGAIVPIGRWVLVEACKTLAEWQRAYGMGELSVAVNVSARQIESPSFVDHVAAAIVSSGIDPSSLVLELTESMLIADREIAATPLQALHQLGVRIAIDDFGTGYSTFSYLQEFPVDILKIDKSFVDTITEVDDPPPIVQGLLDLAQSLHLDTVAEGIEQPTQLEVLRRRCHLGQGYLFAKPLDERQAALLLAAPPCDMPTSIGHPHGCPGP